jgi:hypothetical protein
MKITPVIEQLRAYAHGFEQRVAGGLDWDPTADSAKLEIPAAYVIAVGDSADEPSAQNVITQDVRDAIDVCVVLPTVDERGQSVVDVLHDVRAQLWRALVGFEPDPETGPLLYDGGQLLLLDRERVVYRYRFYADLQLGRWEQTGEGKPQTWQEWKLAGLPALEGIDTRFDFINPLKDSNVAAPGPDGRVEFTTRENLTQ